jgi:hypothetical protein
MKPRPAPEKAVLNDELVNKLRSVTDSEGGYVVKDLLEPTLCVAVTARGRRRLYVTVCVGEWPEVNVDTARAVASRIGEVVAARRMIRRPTRRDPPEVKDADMAAN